MLGSSLPSLILLDREGVLLRHVDPYVLRSADVEPISGSLEAAAAFSRYGVALAVVTNQSPIGRQLVPASFVDATNQRLVEELLEAGAPVPPGIYVCPHTPEDRCGCRKPKPGLLLQAARDASIPLARTWMVGDHESDIEAGSRAGCGATIHVLSGRQTVPSSNASRVVADLMALARLCGII